MDWSTIFRDNEAAWDAKTPVHVASRFYDVPGFLAGASTLNAVERERLGDVRGRSLLHLQCHFGLDTLSLARLGARVTGVDLSGAAIEAARRLAVEAKLGARFVKCNVYETRAHLAETFDLVFTSYGVLGWLPDLRPWAKVVAESLAPGGRFVLVEFHPWVWMSQVGPDLSIRYPYFNRGVISEDAESTYADRSVKLRLREHGFNHPIADVVNALVGAGLRLDRLDELDGSPFDVFPGMVRGEDGLFRFAAAPGMAPLLLAVEASRP